MGQRIAVFGAGVSGRAAANLAKAQGAEVRVYDQREQGDVVEFCDTDAAIHDLFVFSPGFAAEHPWRLSAEASGKPVLSELAFAASVWKGKLYAVTGTNGKTTLTELLANAFAAAGVEAFAVGNIGRPLADLAQTEANKESSVAVCEVSSFQAELIQGLELDGLLWTNFAEDHLDRYSDLAAYFHAKANLLSSLKPDALGYAGFDLSSSMAGYGLIPSKQVALCDVPDWVDSLDSKSVFARAPYSENFQLAARFWEQVGLPPVALVDAANGYELPGHRLSIIAESGGVRFWDDSKATNFQAALAALDSMQGPVFWIGGGQSKGGNVAEFARSVSGRIEKAFVYGEVAETLSAYLDLDAKRVMRFERFEAAVLAAGKAALVRAEGDVLLSPGFSSFDQFQSYSERGKSFIFIVLSLNEGEAAR